MKNFSIGFLCACVLLCGWSRAEEPKADPPPAGDEAVAPQNPTQNPPASDEDLQRGKIPEPPPPPPKVPDIRRPGETGFFIGINTWFPTQTPVYDRANQSTFSGYSRVKMAGTPKVAEGAELGVALGLHNSLRVSYFNSRAAGDFTTGVDTVVASQLYTAGTYVSTDYRIKNFKLSYEYLTWPFPVGSRKFRLKTLWQFQYTQINANFDSPKDYFDSGGNLILDSSGNPISLVGGGSYHIIAPTFGLGTYYYPTRHFRFEASASGFSFPHKSTIWDADASLNLRMKGHLELRLGAKAFHFKTSTDAAFFAKGTMASAFFGVRWYSNSE